MSSRARRVAFLAVFASVLARCPVARASGFVATEAGEYRLDGEFPMRMPSAVAIGIHDEVYVADGVNDRILRFSASGAYLGEIREVGGHALSRPMSVKVDMRGTVWIADTGNARIVALDEKGTVQRVIKWADPATRASVDFTDVVAGDSGESVWVVDNDGHRLLELDWEGRVRQSVGGQGSSLGQFHNPFMAALASDGRVLATDVINGRVQAITSKGIASGTVGSYGVGLGQLYRPEGIAVGTDGTIWVSDGVLSVVQVFDATGAFIDVVRDEQGAPFRFAAPGGIAIDRGGDLYVAEFSANRVRRLSIEQTSREAAAPGAQERHVESQSQPRTCTACHLEWMKPLADGVSTPLAEVPIASVEQPPPSRPEVCFSCHNGTVVDSRRVVWLEHGHQTGVLPPASMHVPDDLPLVNARVACRTCHSAHTRAGSGNTLRDAVFLRVERDATELCVRCHADHSGGLASRSHPVGAMDEPIPEVLRKRGAHCGPDGRTVSCLVCHTPHGSASSDLLLTGTASTDLCMACHRDYQISHSEPVGWGRHPTGSIVSDPKQRSAVAGMGTRLDDGERLMCLTCHRMHAGATQRNLLADSLHGSQLCMRCHASKGSVLESMHDLRLSAPGAVNAHGETAKGAGPCSACHGIHQAARSRAPAVADPSGICLGCHRDEGGGIAKRLIPLLHPAGPTTESHGSYGHRGVPLFLADGTRSADGQVACLTCHDPHGSPEFFLRTGHEDRVSSLCTQCHQNASAIEQSMHDAHAMSAFAANGTSCGPCHVVHARPTRPGDEGMWRAPLGDANRPMVERRCTGCHSEKGGAPMVHPVRHPAVPMSNTVSTGSDGFLPLLDASGDLDRAGRITCMTCHLPHGRLSAESANVANEPRDVKRARKPMLRTVATPSLCTSCHGFDGLRRFLYFHQIESGKDARDDRRQAQRQAENDSRLP